LQNLALFWGGKVLETLHPLLQLYLDGLDVDGRLIRHKVHAPLTLLLLQVTNANIQQGYMRGMAFTSTLLYRRSTIEVDLESCLQ
jgi:hypothetical protein